MENTTEKLKLPQPLEKKNEIKIRLVSPVVAVRKPMKKLNPT
jgi:hypothetical protein